MDSEGKNILKSPIIHISKNDVEFHEYEELDYNSKCKLEAETYPVDESELRTWSITGEGFLKYNKPKPKYNHKRETDSYRIMMKKRKAKNRKKRRMK